ncbi:MAG TPA: ADP-glyceromanno-heptose 6-epimerase [Candidatus Kapabacteria bacterium]|nr:ADP-glyceromanno-heptose 6-epimerase [Candidatus Kapabacteria bacterium]
MIVLTGGAGFIGSVMLARLNEAGYDDILVVDNLASSDKWKNLLGKKFTEYFHKNDFLEVFEDELDPREVEAVIHLGACTSTTERDMDYLIRNNYDYSKTIAEWCFEHEIRFVYASSAATYGDGGLGFSDDNAVTQTLRPLNPYGYSKHLFDLWLVRNNYDRLCAGFKFFNVFGPNEYHKGAMSSLVYKAYHQVNETGALQLFRSYNAHYKDGAFTRDFIYVKDCVDVLMWALDTESVNGIYNLGSGTARSWNDLASALFSAMGKPNNIQYIDMPEEIRSAYQYHTQADMSKLRAAGFKNEFRSLEHSVADYVQTYLSQPEPYL